MTDGYSLAEEVDDWIQDIQGELDEECCMKKVSKQEQKGKTKMVWNTEDMKESLQRVCDRTIEKLWEECGGLPIQCTPQHIEKIKNIEFLRSNMKISVSPIPIEEELHPEERESFIDANLISFPEAISNLLKSMEELRRIPEDIEAITSKIDLSPYNQKPRQISVYKYLRIQKSLSKKIIQNRKLIGILDKRVKNLIENYRDIYKQLGEYYNGTK